MLDLKTIYRLRICFIQKSRVQYLDNLNWNRPWSAGGKFASLCVYSTTQGYNYSNELFEYSSKLLDLDTGSYFVGKPNDSEKLLMVQ